ncbi:ribosome-inactivating family protein [Streptomyces sp. NPDC002044]|uniref:ribosome-inactivating family protein n=1 Tax=Streptomyces sp. NPDC002044 TaxID=3154662 RepID=UPI0033257640
MRQDRSDRGRFPSGESEFRRRHLMRAVMPNPVSFSVESASAEEYRLLASTIRSRAAEVRGFSDNAGGGEARVRYLPVRMQQRGLFVELYIELRVHNPGIRLVGFRNTFEDGQAPPEAHFRHVRDSVAPPGIRRAEALPFGGGRSLEAAADVGRASLPLGRRSMVNAIIWLHRNTDPKCTARAILALSEMLCEAARSPVLADGMARLWMTGGPLSAAMRTAA